MFLTILTFIIILSLLVFVHELGHFWVARRAGVRSEEFGFGFPPRAVGLQRLSGTQGQRWKLIRGAGDPKYTSEEERMEKSTIYSINWVPLGGFVKIKGEDGGQEREKDSFSAKKIWQRALILLAGVSMNIILAMFLISLGFLIGLPQVLDKDMQGARIISRQIQVVEVLPGSPAAAADLKIGDVINSISGRTFVASEELQNFVAGEIGIVLEYKIRRGQEEITKNIKPEVIEETGKGGIGIAIVESGLVRYSLFAAIWQGIKTTLLLTWAIIVAFYGIIKSVILGQSVSADLSGPVGIAVLTGQVTRLGFIYIMQFAAILSINLAIINAMPFPALDGGRLLFLVIEKIKGSPVKKEVEGVIHNIGFALLMILVLLVTFKDVVRYTDVFKNLWERITG